jgi:hypothetical protein
MIIASEGVFDAARTRVEPRSAKPHLSRPRVSYIPRAPAGRHRVVDNEAMRTREVTPHYVPFHMRRLHPGWEASAEAHRTAIHYGFTIPPGFTFVDAHLSPRTTRPGDPPGRVIRSLGALELLNAIRLVLRPGNDNTAE